MTARWGSSLEGQLIIRLAAIHFLAMLVGFLALANKRYRLVHISDEIAVWVFPLFVLVVLATVILTVRASLRPLLDASRQAAAIEPGQGGSRLDGSGAPAEIIPFVRAVNDALQRLDQAFQAQRRFTADAAHELRTPLAILTAGLDALPLTRDVAKLRDDAARMGRLVDQLLRVARLDAQPPTLTEWIDLRALATEVTAQLAPWAFEQGRRLALEAPDHEVRLKGDADAIAGALRNLIENAVYHSPLGTEVLVEVTGTAILKVIDQGPGIPHHEREHVFERFWRAAGTTRPGAGLGLAIVAAVAQGHGGTITIEDRIGGGAIFSLHMTNGGDAF